MLLSHTNCLLAGEWEISAYDGSLKSRGMSIRYSVLYSNDEDRVDRDGIVEDISDYIDQIDLQVRSRRPENHTVLVRVCKKPLADNDTQSVNASSQNVTTDTTGAEGQSGCWLKNVTVTSLEGGNPGMVSEGEIPQDILEKIERDGEWMVSQNGTEPGEEGSVRMRRHAEGNWTDVDISSGASGNGGTLVDIEEESVENRTDAGAEVQAEERSEMSSVNNGTKVELEESNEILLNNDQQLNEKVSTVERDSSEEMDQNFVPQNHVQSERERLTVDVLDRDYNYTTVINKTTGIDLSLEYDDYGQEVLLSVFMFIHLLSIYNSIC